MLLQRKYSYLYVYTCKQLTCQIEADVDEDRLYMSFMYII